MSYSFELIQKIQRNKKRYYIFSTSFKLKSESDGL
jgi:hypothetical protein